MKLPRSFASVAFALVLLVGVHDSLRAQVIETRESEGNPVVTVFKGSLYGAGTGLVLGGAWALLESDSRGETEDILKWSVGVGALTGAAVGALYLLFRENPDDDGAAVVVPAPAAFDATNGSFGVPALRTSQRVDVTGETRGRLEARLLQATF
jgi:hypothetical protein